MPSSEIWAFKKSPLLPFLALYSFSTYYKSRAENVKGGNIACGNFVT
jgi:hypothetical protein